jgi:hypothetical protein
MLASGCDDAAMVEYGNAAGQVAGRAGGGSGAGGRNLDVGAQVGQFASDSIHTISTLPPAALLAGFVIIVLGLVILRRVF